MPGPTRKAGADHVPSITGRAPRLSAGARLRRITAILAVAAGGVLAWAAAVPAASAATIPVPGAGAGYAPAPAALPSPVRVITAGGMPPARYRGLRKTHLGHVCPAVALNLRRLDAYWNDTPLNRATTSHLARLEPTA